jgi:hypothetical protein
MENTNTNFPETEKWNRRERNKRVAGGIVLLAVGGLLLAREAGAVLPEWLFTWQMIVIAVGLYIGLKSGFRDLGWLIPVTVGVVFLADRFVEGFSPWPYLWPIVIIAAGLSMIIRRRSCSRW